ncbi:MAG TPA: T9SS type A sorting domain-containing protein [Ignavibacteria bacterium]|nr:T9SS type A sorting domain-containing protein [Ignavibacteria bacterium]HMR41956.1 T9SS type A sorting domain-containing protein [Ignavibacteria bacterium]
MKNKLTLIVLAVLLFNACYSTISYSQDTAKIMGYNLLNYNTNEARNVYFRKTLAYTSPDILGVCEIVSQDAVNEFLTQVLNADSAGLYSAGEFINGPDTDNAIFYKSSKFTFISNIPIATSLRYISLFTLKHILSNDTIRIFVCHLKASSGSGNEAQRLEEVNTLRTVTNSFPAGTEFLITGDFNIYSSNEAAYLRLLQVDAGTDGQFIDNYSLSGTWNQSSYAQYHSQSTRVRQFGGGATGGMDDRFDFVLNSTALIQEGRIKYIPNSLKPFGNDGNHYNDSINQRPNTAVPDSIADALAYSSDHLPVTALYKFDMHPSNISTLNSINPGGFSLSQNYPNPFNPNTVIRYTLSNSNKVQLKIYNSRGIMIKELVNERQTSGEYTYNFNATVYPSGVYYYKLTVDKFTETKSMMLVK